MDKDDHNDCYDGLARSMGCKPDEVPGLVQQHAPWNGADVCESTIRERKAVLAFLEEMNVSPSVRHSIERGQHLPTREQRLTAEVAAHRMFAWGAGMLAISLNDGTRHRVVLPGETPRLIDGSLQPRTLPWDVPGTLIYRYVPDLRDAATAGLLCSLWLDRVYVGERLAEALLERWSKS
jgi:hypothetical protein